MPCLKCDSRNRGEVKGIELDIKEGVRKLAGFPVRAIVCKDCGFIELLTKKDAIPLDFISPLSKDER